MCSPLLKTNWKVCLDNPNGLRVQGSGFRVSGFWFEFLVSNFWLLVSRFAVNWRPETRNSEP